MEMEFAVFGGSSSAHRSLGANLFCKSEATKQSDIRRRDHHSHKKGRQSENDNT